MNACNESVGNTPERERAARLSSPPADPTPAAEAPGQTAAPAGSSLDRWLLTRLRTYLGDPPIELAVRAGARAAPADGAVIARVTFASRATLLAVLSDPWLRFGDAYSDGSVTVDGDLVSLLETVYRSSAASGTRLPLARRAASLRHRPHANTLAGSRDNIHRHYDIGNQFYQLWLGATMAYTCAYYPTPEATLEQAQSAKMDHVCRKLQLKPGESVVEAGCGWGTLALHMARHYGVRVRAFNISREQVAYARERAAREGLASRVEYIEDDYRNISGNYDAFVSVGMLEHVGLANYETLGGVAHQCLGGRGRGLIHAIGRNFPARLQPWIERAHFPGSLPADARADDAHLRALELLDARRREPAAALRADAAPLAVTVRGGQGSGVRHVRRQVRAHVAAVSCGLRGRLQHRHAAAVPGGVRSRGQQRRSDDPRASVHARERALVRGADRRRRPGRLERGTGAKARGRRRAGARSRALSAPEAVCRLDHA